VPGLPRFPAGRRRYDEDTKEGLFVHAPRAKGVGDRRAAARDFGTVSYAVSAADGTSLASHSPTEIIMADAGGSQEDSTSAISSAGAFSNSWLRSS
jgi:hypothetical protein